MGTPCRARDLAVAGPALAVASQLDPRAAVPARTAPEVGTPVGFGWAAALPGVSRGQAAETTRDLVARVERSWRSSFPADQGYLVEMASPAGASHGVRLRVARGDFRAAVDVTRGRSVVGASSKATRGQIRMSGRAGSARMRLTERRARHLVAVARAGGIGVGLTVFAVVCWLLLGVRNPAVLGGLLMVVALLFVTTAGATVGGWLGEAVASRLRDRSHRETSDDRDLRRDLDRWQAICRTLSREKDVLERRGELAFRSPAAAAIAAG